MSGKGSWRGGQGKKEKKKGGGDLSVVVGQGRNGVDPVSRFAGEDGHQDGGQSTQNRGEFLNSSIHPPAKSTIVPSFGVLAEWRSGWHHHGQRSSEGKEHHDCCFGLDVVLKKTGTDRQSELTSSCDLRQVTTTGAMTFPRIGLVNQVTKRPALACWAGSEPSCGNTTGAL